MATVLVTGGTGTLGSVLLPELASRGHDVRSLTRHPPAAAAAPGAAAPGAAAAGPLHLTGDVRTGAGLAAAMDGASTVIHTATSPRLSRAVEVDGTANVVAEAAKVGAHVIYVSIVGVDTMAYSYYRAKGDAEKVVQSGSAPWTVQRATQFHDLIDRFLGFRVVPVTRHLSFQPVDPSELSVRLADLVDAGPTGRAPDFGGPAVVALRQLAATRRLLTGSPTLLLPVPPVGPLRDFDRGRHLCPDHADGRISFEDWLRARPSR